MRPVLLDISIPLAQAERLLQDPVAADRGRYAALRDSLARDARNPLVIGRQREAAFRLAGELAARMAEEARSRDSPLG